MAVDVRTIVITGGPCGGKTTALELLRKELEGRGWQLVFVPECATALISAGVAPWTCESRLEFQRRVFQLQLAQERVFRDAASAIPAEKVLLVCDRGLLDGKGYLQSGEFDIFLKEAGLSYDDIHARYDAVYHLMTAAKGALEYYTLTNNATRREPPEEAAKLDGKIVAAWKDHPQLCVIDNSTGFELKLARLVHEVLARLNEDGWDAGLEVL
ncbi:MAG: ATP-binding protein [Atopobiaceae bacterium]|nr:ATP-binding protein [Atopobiaceae bacterium]